MTKLKDRIEKWDDAYVQAQIKEYYIEQIKIWIFFQDEPQK